MYTYLFIYIYYLVKTLDFWQIKAHPSFLLLLTVLPLLFSLQPELAAVGRSFLLTALSLTICCLSYVWEKSFLPSCDPVCLLHSCHTSVEEVCSTFLEESVSSEKSSSRP